MNRQSHSVCLLLLVVLILEVANPQSNGYGQVSQCLGNCISCSSTAPSVCEPLVFAGGAQVECLPFYRGPSCEVSTLAYEVCFEETVQGLTGSEESFAGWNVETINTCQLLVTNEAGEEVQLEGESNSYTSLGPVSGSSTLLRGLSLGSAASEVVIKFSVAVTDPGMVEYFESVSSSSSSNSSTSTNSSTSSSNTETIQEVQPDGSIIIRIITRVNETVEQTNTINQFNQQNVFNIEKIVRNFLLLELLDTTNGGGDIIGQKNIGFDSVSPVSTTCGLLYTFQVGFSLGSSFSSAAAGSQLSLALRMSMNEVYRQSGGSWSLLSFSSSVGCRGYVVSSGSGTNNCDVCLSGFYAVRSLLNGALEECRLCDPRCQTCLSADTCLTCVPNTFYNPSSGMCEYSSNFQIRALYQLIIGQHLQTDARNQILFGQQVIQSQGGIIRLQQSLSRGSQQSYTVRFMMLYSAAFRNSGQIIQVVINGQTFELSAETLPLFAANQFAGIAGSSSSIYQSQVSYTINSSVSQSSNQSLNFQENVVVQIIASQFGSVAVLDEFAIANFQLIEFQCSENCFSCQYSEFTQLSTCSKCDYFFDLDTGCQECANGYYETSVSPSELTTTYPGRCIKCHSTCLQCSGPSIDDCSVCYSGFRLAQVVYEYGCINCLYRRQFESNPDKISQCANNPTCLSEHPFETVLTNSQCRECLASSEDINSVTGPDASQDCRSCWLAQRLAQGRCEPVPERGYQLLGSDVSNGVISSQWTSNRQITVLTINQFYTNLYGVSYVPSPRSAAERDNENSGTSTSQETTLKFREPSLPPHRGLTIFFTIFRMNQWGSLFLDNLNSQSINIIVRSADSVIVRNETIQINNTYGNNIFGDINSGNEMMYTFYGQYEDHTNEGPLDIELTCTHTGVFVKDLEVYLGNCQGCSGGEVNYEVYYIPMYSTNSSQTGLDVWLEFNQDITVESSDSATEDQILNSFQFSIDQVAGYSRFINFTILDNQLDKWQYVKYFLPLEQSLLNATLRVNNSLGYNVFSRVGSVGPFLDLSEPSLHSDGRRNLLSAEQSVDSEQPQRAEQAEPQKRLLLNERLSTGNVETRIARFEHITLDERKSMEQLEDFYEFFNWFTLITMIVFAFFGLGIVFEEFSILVQLLFIHIYVSTNILPATFKRPFSALEKMENLNFFAYPHADNIEEDWFEGIMQQSPFPFTQYNFDVYFTRLIYAVLIINMIYLGWFIILFVLLKAVRAFRNSPNKVIKFFRDIPQRPLNYFDQIWRYQFIAVVFAAFLQFQEFSGETAEMRLNLAVCIMAFIFVVVYPVFVMIYTYRQHKVLNVEHFLYLYHDIYYRKISSIADRSTYYLYIAVRFGRYFLFALFIALFVYQDVIAPVILLAITFLELIYIFNFKIFRDKVYLAFKVIENIGFIVLEILILIVYGFSDDVVSEQGYRSLGHGINALVILMIINGLIRFFYLAFKRIKDFITGRYDYGEKGELINFDNKNPIVTMQSLPATERALNQQPQPTTDRNY